jgi:hypothetical protein
MSKTLTTDQRFDKIDVQSQEMRDEMGKMHKSMNEQFDRISAVVVKGFGQNKREHEKMASKEDVERIFDLIDKWAKRQEISDEERLVMGHQLDRVNRWIKDLADKIGYELTY